MRRRNSPMLALLLLAASGAVTASAATPGSESRCQAVPDGRPVAFHGRTLVETPDIEAPALRRANVLLSHRCRAEAIEVLNAYRQAHPDDYHARFVEARLAWTAGDDIRAEEIVFGVLREHPDFASAQVLLTSLYIEQNRPDDARAVLDSLTLHAPTDLWVYMDSLRLEALSSPSAALRDTLLEINKDARFPPSARETASHAGRGLPNLTRAQFEAYYWADLEYESATPMACKIHNLAFNLSVVDGRQAEARKLLESPKALAADCAGMEGNRVLLALSYLMEAAQVSAGPSPQNAALVSKAHEVLGGDWSTLARFVMGRTQFAALQPFIASATSPADVDAAGRTQICNAVMLADVAAVQAQLDLGADPNGRCEYSSLIGEPIRATSATPTRAAWQQDIVRMLRAAGARVTPDDLAWCRNRDNGPECSKSLLPLLEP